MASAIAAGAVAVSGALARTARAMSRRGRDVQCDAAVRTLTKIAGILLILAALIGGGIILSETIPGWMRNRDYLARAHSEAAAQKQKLDAVNPNASEAELRRTLSSAENAVRSIRDAEGGIVRRRNETLMFGGGALAVLALGTFLFLRGRRKQPATVARPLVAA